LDEYHKALEAATAALAIDPKDDFALSYRGAAQIYIGDYAAAIKDEMAALALEQAAKNPDSFTYAHLGAAHYFNGDYAAAIADQTRALRLDSKYAYAHSYLGAAHLKQNRYKDAVEDETRAIALDPTSSFALSHRGAARYYLSDFKGAVADERAALKIDPADDYAKQYLAAAVKQLHRGMASATDALAMHAELLILAAVQQVNATDKPGARHHNDEKKGSAGQFRAVDPEPASFPGGAKVWKHGALPQNDRKHK
jgi:tetratricopeptide (TPR) repeat protein